MAITIKPAMHQLNMDFGDIGHLQEGESSGAMYSYLSENGRYLRWLNYHIPAAKEPDGVWC